MNNPWTGTENKLKGGRIEDWTILGSGQVMGRIYDDPRGDQGDYVSFEDGNLILTSKIVKFRENESLLETKNTIYTLGKKI